MHTAIVINDLTFGDAGKGSITDTLARRGAGLVVRYNGGAQAAHTVIDDNGRSHTFRQFGSGSLIDCTETFLSRYMLVNPISLLYEEEALRKIGVFDAYERMHIDARALVTTPYHMALNQLRELARGSRRHGSCGLGIGETAADAQEHDRKALRFGDLSNIQLIKGKLEWHRALKQRQAVLLMPKLLEQDISSQDKIRLLIDQLHSDDELEAAVEVFAGIAKRVDVVADNFLANRLQRPGITIFEGAQGVLLDEQRGFLPHNSWTNTTPDNALQLIREASDDVQTTVLGICRAYQTRHGAGPMPTESDEVTRALPELHNSSNDWQGPFRVGWLDLSLLRYAVCAAGRIDGLIVTCLDRLHNLPDMKVGNGYAVQGLPWLLPTGQKMRGHQSTATGIALRHVEVEYVLPPLDPNDYALWIAGRLGLPLLGVSFGSTSREKTFQF